MNRDRWAAVLATIAVVVVLILGLHVMGTPGKQRLIQADFRTVQALGQLSQQIKMAWNNSEKVLPESLEKVPNAVKQDPVTKKPFTYHPKSGSQYELCATFATDDRELQTQNPNNSWVHPKGDYCFQLDASQDVLQVPYYY